MKKDGKESVRRRLFEGGEEGTRTDNRIEEASERILDQQSKKWNFDFRNEVPLPGPWQWERVQPTPQQVSANDESPKEPTPEASDTEDQQQSEEEEPKDEDGAQR